MPVQAAEHTIGHRARTFPIAWPSLGALALAAALADGFWATGLRGAVGAIGPAQHPFGRWWRDALLLVPLHALALVGAAVLIGRLARRQAWAARRRAVATFVCAAAVTTVVGVATVTTRAFTDYRTQRAEIVVRHASHGSAVPASATAGGCDARCSALRLTAAAHRTGVEQSVVLLLVTNLVVCGVVMVVAGGLWRRPRAASQRASRPFGSHQSQF